ncbi:GNAT family N-acetyltransferase [Pediococcus ethanolidurans]|uniref:Acetyltransferase n=1 Tax=Pediococcus ethanolidurans TaxID=319653 RepID=A0A0R2K110_9LACO|nr:GNAT family N-acetyltransferase [Pediococcus ethanolidurans]KRN83272.1 hypothetical protein IV87_GL001305 [Pediococcus ethanolidurans]GEN94592.1 acetyltransferase [Pediococcus ethanolidurans]SER30339.1 putative acetyltransferase [Pediococcus ethanolidurans]
MKIQKVSQLTPEQLDQVMQIWLEGNLSAHDFVSPEYWHKNYDLVATLIQKATLILAIDDKIIVGFLGLMDHYIAGLFVREDVQSQGIGAQLVNAAKATIDPLTLDVYEKNDRAVKFYKKHGFDIVEKRKDKDTNENELVMKTLAK